jgi:hypothetical protein
MKKNPVALRTGIVLLAACGLVSCAAPDHHPPGPPGGSGTVVHPVLGKGGRWACGPGAVCELTVDVATCTVKEEYTQVEKDQIVRWRVPHGWSFPSNGIEFKPGAVDPRLAFDHPNSAGSHFQWHVTREAPPNPAGYAYRVRVTGPSGKSCDFDPALWV